MKTTTDSDVPPAAERLLDDVQAIMKEEQWEAAVKTLRRHEDMVWTDARLCWHLGWAHFRLNEFSEAVSVLRRASELNPTDHTSLWALGVSLREAGLYQEAELELLRAIALRDGSLPRLALATLYLTLRRDSEAEQVQREGVRLQPLYRERMEALADLLGDLGKQAEAMAIRQDAEKLPTRDERRARERDS